MRNQTTFSSHCQPLKRAKPVWTTAQESYLREIVENGTYPMPGGVQTPEKAEQRKAIVYELSQRGPARRWKAVLQKVTYMGLSKTQCTTVKQPVMVPVPRESRSVSRRLQTGLGGCHFGNNGPRVAVLGVERFAGVEG